MDELLEPLRAIAESTRFRILVAVDSCDLTVGELCRVLGQTQPRVSRHLKLLTDANVLERHPQGASAYFRPARETMGRKLIDAVLPLVDLQDAVLAGDRLRLEAIRNERSQRASEYFAAIAQEWDQIRELHVADEKVEAAMVKAVAGLKVTDLLDIGTGTGRVLEVFANIAERGLGIDPSSSMLDVARSRLDAQGLRNCGVRQGDVYSLGLDPGSFDVAVVHHVLHFLDDPGSAVSQVARTLRPGGRIVIVDFATHALESMRTDHAHHWLGFGDDEVTQWCRDAGLIDISIDHLRPRRRGETLTTTIWVATQHPQAPSVRSLNRSLDPSSLATKAAS